MEPSKDQRRSPSPCNYNVPTTLFKTNKITMKGRYPVAGEDKSDVPGPGMYKIPSSCDRSGIIRLKGRTQLPNPLIGNPGPGAYYHDTFNTSAKSITLGGRTEAHAVNDTPSPCHYKIDYQSLNSPTKISLKSRNKDLAVKSNTEFLYSPMRPKTDLGQITLKSRHEVSEQKTKDTPAPCDYVNTIPRHYKTDITLKSRPKEVTDRNTIGPGQYNPNFSYGRKNVCSPDIKFKGKTQIIDPSIKQVTDAFYNIPDTIRSMKQVSLKGRTAVSYDNKIPGPGAYNARYEYIRSPTKDIKIGGRTEKPGTLDYNLKSNDSPGPIYNIRGSNSPVNNITLKSRHPVNSDNEVPGPGQYDVREQFNKNAQRSVAITLKGRLPDIAQKQDEVGPGTYNTDQGSYQRAQKQGISFGVRTYGQVQGYTG